MKLIAIAVTLSAALASAFAADAGFVFEPKDGPGKGKHAVFVTGDDEYHSEEGMPLLAHILAERHGFKCTVLFAINKQTGAIDPGAQDNIPGLEALDNADLMVIFTRFRSLPDAQMKHIVDYVESGRPVLGLRTATHAFNIKDPKATYAKWTWTNKDAAFEGGFGRQVLGETWINHWGGHGSESTRGVFAPGMADHPILRGVKDGGIWGKTDVYQVRLPLPATCTPLIMGQVLAGMTPEAAPVAGKKNEPMMPVAWTNAYKAPNGKTARVFTTTMGGAMSGGRDWDNEALRRVLVNAAYWCAGLEDQIPAKSNVDTVTIKNPFKRGLKPSEIKIPDAGEHILFYGDSLVERLFESGQMEAWMQLAQSGKPLRLRSLAWTGDEVGHRLRPEGYVEHLKNLIEKWPARTVVLGAGMNESFGGRAGLADFKAQLAAYARELLRRHPGAKLVLLSPIAVEANGPDTKRGEDAALYAAAMREFAQAGGYAFIDLFSARERVNLQAGAKLTSNGIHPNEAGLRSYGKMVAAGLLGETALARVDRTRVDELAKAVAQKNLYNAEITRPKNADLYYGVRKRADEYAQEMPRYDQMLAQSEKIVHEMARSQGPKFTDFPPPSLPPMPEGKRGDAGKGTGTVKPAIDAQAEFKVADGYTLNLFASDEQFPDLRAPVQIAFDARGRLWVVTMPSFPHTVPGMPREDKVLILEDTNRDGKADKCTVFADQLDALDGVAFNESGVIVSEQPRLWVMRDTDGDGRADSRRELLRGLDVTDSHHGGMCATDPQGHVWFCDGVFHRSQIETPFGVQRGIDSTTYRLNPLTGSVSAEWQSTTPNPWKMTFDRYGNAFQMYGDGLTLDCLALTWTPLGVYHPFAHAKTLGYGKGSACASISSPNFPDDYQQGMASAALLGTYAVSLTKFDYSNGMVKGSGRLDLVSSQNPAFRPVDVEFGFDGALYVSDFTSAIIGHAQHPMRDPQWNHAKGRIWRVVHKGKPLVKEWPVIQGANAEALCGLLTHSQDVVRHHARIELRSLGNAGLGMVDSWIEKFDRKSQDFDQAALEALFVGEGLGQTRPQLLGELLKSQSPLHRAAAVHMVRLQADRLPNAVELLHQMASDPHPRVQMEVVDAVAHLRPAMPQVEHALHGLVPTQQSVKQMMEDLQYGTQPAKGRSVEVLEIAADTRLRFWLRDSAKTEPTPFDSQSKTNPVSGSGTYRTWVDADAAQSAVIAVKHGYVDISINDVQVLSTESMWSSEQQAQLELRKGLNLIEVVFRRVNGTPPKVSLFDPLGQKLSRVKFAADIAGVQASAEAWKKLNAATGDALKVQAVPNRMAFEPRELRVKAGQKVRIIFENPDLMLHNFVLVAIGADEEVGLAAEKMATQFDAMTKSFIPESNKILQATKLVNPKGRAELNFDAPAEKGKYPYICTFPGHFRIMRGVLIVE